MGNPIVQRCTFCCWCLLPWI